MATDGPSSSIPLSTTAISAGGFKIILKNAKIHAEKLIIKRTEKEKKKLIKQYTEEMKDAAKNLQFERAAELRDMISKLKDK